MYKNKEDFQIVSGKAQRAFPRLPDQGAQPWVSTPVRSLERGDPWRRMSLTRGVCRSSVGASVQGLQNDSDVFPRLRPSVPRQPDGSALLACRVPEPYGKAAPFPPLDEIKAITTSNVRL